jgi:hypothetical protein
MSDIKTTQEIALMYKFAHQNSLKDTRSAKYVVKELEKLSNMEWLRADYVIATAKKFMTDSELYAFCTALELLGNTDDLGLGGGQTPKSLLDDNSGQIATSSELENATNKRSGDEGVSGLPPTKLNICTEEQLINILEETLPNNCYGSHKELIYYILSKFYDKNIFGCALEEDGGSSNGANINRSSSEPQKNKRKR